MDVEMLAQVAFTHGGALDVPARPSTPPRGVPGWFSRLGRFPQYKIEWIALAAINLDSFTGSKVIKGFARKLPVVFKLPNRIEHIAVGGPICDSLVNELLDERQHLGNVIGGARLNIGRQHIQGGSVLIHRLNEPARQRFDGYVFLRRPPDNLVVDVGDIADISHLEPRRFQPALDDIEYH